jgi:hypothetical protein
MQLIKTTSSLVYAMFSTGNVPYRVQVHREITSLRQKLLTGILVTSNEKTRSSTLW